MSKSISNLNYCIAIVLFSFVFSSCSKKDNLSPQSTTSQTNQFIYNVMKNQAWYLWHEKIPEVNPDLYDDSNKFLEALMYKELDKWSFLTDVESYNKLFEKAEYFGFGFSYSFDLNNNLRVSFVFKNSPMDKAGISRGFKILEINKKTISEINNNNLWGSITGENAAGVSIPFKFINLKGDTLSKDIIKETVVQNTVLYRDTIQIGNKIAGYLVFQSFLEPSKAELDEAFTYFKAFNINYLILDLRYNGGGMMSIANHLGNLIGGTKATGQIFEKMQFNAQHEDENTKSQNTFIFSSLSNSISPEQVVCITSKGTASASESVINGLKPYFKVVLIGNDTHGKPVGMSGFQYNQDLLFPITFKVVNSKGEGDYFQGLKADAYRSDGLDLPFGNHQESCLKEGIYYLQNGSFSNVAKQSTMSKYSKNMEMNGFRALIGAY
jgi:C-terminal processing protease CtpA/Prc